MKLAIILVLCSLAAGDVVHLKSAKAKLLGRLAGRHHKRGVPAYKLGYDIPTVTHSVVKPLVVSYPLTASVTAVKVPLVHPLIPRHPVPRFPAPHSHTHKFHNTKNIVVPKPDQHFHHHHHHVAPRPVLPIVPAPVPATPFVPIGQPTIAHPIPAPAPPVVLPPSPVLPPPSPIFPATTSVLSSPVAHLPSPVHFLPSDPFRVKPIIPTPFSVQPAPVPQPLIPLTQQYPYILRAGNAVQTSVFATYPRYPFVNYQSSLVPLTAPAAPTGPVYLERPEAHIPQVHLIPQAGPQEVIEHQIPSVAVESTPTLLHPAQAIPQPSIHLQQGQPLVPVEHDGWSPVASQPHDLSVHTQETHIPQDAHHFSQEQGTQVYEHHDEYQHQLQHHIQQQIEQAQYEQHVNNQHQFGNEYGGPHNVDQDFNNQDFAQGQFTQHGQDFGHGQQFIPHGQDLGQGQQIGPHGQDFGGFGQAGQFAHGQEFGHGQFAHGQDLGQGQFSHGQDLGQGQLAPGLDFGQGQQFGPHGQDFGQGQQGHFGHGQDFGQGQHFGQDSSPGQQPAQEYGVPAEGRSGEGEAEPQRFHNHIPLGLQLPLDRPLEHFR